MLSIKDEQCVVIVGYTKEFSWLYVNGKALTKEFMSEDRWEDYGWTIIIIRRPSSDHNNCRKTMIGP